MLAAAGEEESGEGTASDPQESKTSHPYGEASREELVDRLLRLRAEFDNYRKRTERAGREAGETAVAELTKALLPVVDALDRASEAPAPEAALAFQEGIHRISQELESVLRERGLEEVPAVGCEFDPEIHEAVGTVPPADGEADGTVAEVERKGWSMRGRLLRPARVIVRRVN